MNEKVSLKVLFWREKFLIVDEKETFKETKLEIFGLGLFTLSNKG